MSTDRTRLRLSSSAAASFFVVLRWMKSLLHQLKREKRRSEMSENQTQIEYNRKIFHIVLSVLWIFSVCVLAEACEMRRGMRQGYLLIHLLCDVLLGFSGAGILLEIFTKYRLAANGHIINLWYFIWCSSLSQPVGSRMHFLIRKKFPLRSNARLVVDRLFVVCFCPSINLSSIY